MEQNKDIRQNGEIILYQPDSSIRLEVRMEKETVWLNRQQMATLFDRDIKTFGKHINNALSQELRGLSTVAKFATTRPWMFGNVTAITTDSLLSTTRCITSVRRSRISGRNCLRSAGWKRDRKCLLCRGGVRCASARLCFLPQAWRTIPQTTVEAGGISCSMINAKRPIILHVPTQRHFTTEFIVFLRRRIQHSHSQDNKPFLWKINTNWSAHSAVKPFPTLPLGFPRTSSASAVANAPMSSIALIITKSWN